LIFRDDEVYATGGRCYAYDEDGKPKPGDLEKLRSPDGRENKPSHDRR
jgi:hypothetical protein